MDSNIIKLVKLGHERSDELKAACGAVDVRSVAQLISDLASQLEVQYVRAEESQREFRSADITMQNLEAKCLALAAENAKLADCANFYRLGFKPVKGAFGIEYRPTEQLLDDCGNTAIEAIKTPATDAFLAEVRASAIDSLVDIKTKQLADMHPDTHAFGSTAMSIRNQINELQVFAAQIRQGGAPNEQL
ncbi:TPA: hypothetical protein MYP81_000668 [Citrobacter farmeri]|nr:hypothetical protein [Citrobacter farmeri]HCB1659799.1 hypothetical protein [Citrobacter farmeri]HCB1663622.1 hypothetical protein [Citrobacter farmeri]HCB1670811.1 hypothetical protein [Citrobacter farmeri]HCB1775426.1 hypothetical protein [Citrobacter farmeri]